MRTILVGLDGGEVAESAALIAMCAYGHGAIHHLMSGGLPRRIIQDSPVPVLAVR